MSENKVEMVRVNTRVSSTMNDWIDKMSQETGMPKSTIIMLALEDYRKQHEVIVNMSNMSDVMAKLEKIERQLPSEK